MKMSLTGQQIQTSLAALGAIVLLSNAVSLAAAAEGTPTFTEAVGQHGVADWTNGTVRAIGIGFPPKDAASPLHAKLMAERAAQSVALRNLLEAIQGVRVDSNTTVKNFMVVSDDINVKMTGMIERAKIVKKQENPDGSVEMTVELELRGPVSNLIVPKPTTKAAPLAKKGPPSSMPQPLGFTGLVVDARGMGAQPALAPKILNEDGEEAYSVAYVEGQQLVDNGIVVYVPDLASARTNSRVTNQPLVVKALRVNGSNKSDLVISNADAQIIHMIPAHYRFLQKAQVLVVLDNSQSGKRP